MHACIADVTAPTHGAHLMAGCRGLGHHSVSERASCPGNQNIAGQWRHQTGAYARTETQRRRRGSATESNTKYRTAENVRPETVSPMSRAIDGIVGDRWALSAVATTHGRYVALTGLDSAGWWALCGKLALPWEAGQLTRSRSLAQKANHPRQSLGLQRG